MADIDPMDDEQFEAWEAHKLEQGFARVLADSDRLYRLGIIDASGRLLKDELPEAMRPDSQADISTL